MATQYSIMPLTNNNKTIAYMAAKCHVIKKTEYENNGQKDSLFHVVFDWEPNGSTNILPIYDENKNCVNSIIVDEVFDSLKQCKQRVEQLNDELAKNEIKNAGIFEAREIAAKLRKNFQLALNMQEEHLVVKNTENEKKL